MASRRCAKRLDDCGCDGFAGFFRKQLGEFVGFSVFDVEVHGSTILPRLLPFCIADRIVFENSGIAGMVDLLAGQSRAEEGKNAVAGDVAERG